jgi:hypothetical protein
VSESEDRSAAVLHTWVTPKFAREVRELAETVGRSVSNLIKVALSLLTSWTCCEG